MKRRAPEVDETPTPKTSGSFSLFRDEARRVAELLDGLALVYRKRLDLYDAAKVARAEENARRLRALADRFDGWPKLDGERVAKEREKLVPELVGLLRSALEQLEAAPTAGALGRVRR